MFEEEEQTASIFRVEVFRVRDQLVYVGTL
jgi:hypothetical protein